MKKIAFLKLVSLVVVAVCATCGLVANGQTPPNKTRTTTDVKIRQRMGPGMETVLYIKGPRMRSEMAGDFGMTTILQCDLKRTLTINDKAKTYMITPTDSANTSAAISGADGGGINTSVAPSTPQRGGVVNITQTLTDTGERKQMFGFTARHIKTSLVKTASPDACDKDQKIETDGWYIDFQYEFECPGQRQKYQPTVRPQRPGCQEEIRTKTIGTAKLGFPVLVTTTIYEPDGSTTTTTQEVLELSKEPLSAALFEEPEGYRLVKNAQELYGLTASTPAAAASPSSTSGANSASITSSPTNVWATTGGPKKAGVVRIGLIMPKVQMSSGEVGQAAEALRGDFATYLKGPNIEVIPLSARLASQATEEARQSECDYMLYLSMSVKKGGRSMFGRAIGNIAGSAAGIPVGGSATTAAARSAAISGVYTTAVIVSSIKVKDELSLEYKLDSVEAGRTVLSNTAKAKAKSDGEDILTPLIETSAQTIVSTVRKT